MRVPGCCDLDLRVAVFAHCVEAEEGEEEVGLDACHTGAVGHDQGGVEPSSEPLETTIATFSIVCGSRIGVCG